MTNAQSLVDLLKDSVKSNLSPSEMLHEYETFTHQRFYELSNEMPLKERHELSESYAIELCRMKYKLGVKDGI